MLVFVGQFGDNNNNNGDDNDDDADNNNDNGDDDGGKDKSDDDADAGDGDCESLKFKVEEGDTLYVDYEGTLEVTLQTLKLLQRIL